MPSVRIEAAGGEDVDGRALLYLDVGDEEPGVVLGHILVDSGGKDAEVPVEEEDHEKGEDGDGGDLDDGPYLASWRQASAKEAENMRKRKTRDLLFCASLSSGRWFEHREWMRTRTTLTPRPGPSN